MLSAPWRRTSSSRDRPWPRGVLDCASRVVLGVRVVDERCWLGTGASAGAFDDFYEATNQRVLRATYALTGDLEEARDCTQDAYERAWRRWDQVERHADPEAWVRSAARRLAVSRWRRSRVAVKKLHLLSRRESSPEPSGDHVLLMAALRQLERGQREAIVLHHLCGLSVEEVAAE